MIRNFAPLTVSIIALAFFQAGCSSSSRAPTGVGIVGDGPSEAAVKVDLGVLPAAGSRSETVRIPTRSPDARIARFRSDCPCVRGEVTKANSKIINIKVTMNMEDEQTFTGQLAVGLAGLNDSGAEVVKLIVNAFVEPAVGGGPGPREQGEPPPSPEPAGPG